MTTTVKLKTHGWPVQVTTTDHGANGEEFHSEIHVEPNSERDFYIHSTRSLSFKELPESKAEAPAEDTVAA
jgi:hypothetical protein